MEIVDLRTFTTEKARARSRSSNRADQKADFSDIYGHNFEMILRI
jgi:hypothetical protein